MTTVYFLLTIDTEEDNAWNLDFRPHTDVTVENIQHLPPFQQFCNEIGLRPTYLIDYPVAVDQTASAILRQLFKEGQCEIGTHVHPWCNPPYTEERNHRNSYLNNLPPELQYDKLRVLTETIEERIGTRPVSYRAGRYGFDHSTVPVLETLNYVVDSSVVPLRNNKNPDEPSFTKVSLLPYHLNRKNVCQPGDSPIVEIPITVDFTRKIPGWLKQAYPTLPDIGIRRILRILFGIEMAWLRPSYASLAAMQRLADVVIASGVPILNMMFHSSELMPGGSPYNKTSEDVEQFLIKIKSLIAYLSERYALRFITLKEVPTLVL